MKISIGKHTLIRISLLVLLISIGFSLCYVIQLYKNKQAEKRVVFLDWDHAGDYATLISMDLNGNQIQSIGNATGSVDWSKDGKYLAVGCTDKSKICIYDPEKFPDFRKFPPIIHPEAAPDEFSVPQECISLIRDEGLSSISWSNDGNRLMIVCQDGENSNACVLNLDGTYKCWGEKSDDEIYSRADWSPTDDLIVIDPGLQSYIVPGEGNQVGEAKFIKVVRTGRKMLIVDPLGNIINTLIDGWSPAWSPDGKEIAFYRWDDEKGYPGLASINPAGSNFHWIYRSPKRGSGGNLEEYKPNFSDVFNCMGSSKISWSADQKYLVIEAQMGMCTFAIFRIEVRNGIVENLTSGNYSVPQEPDVQP